jgi:diguanylate cyclase (GGDEF)-like protein/PAS domain S-box-containing protein
MSIQNDSQDNKSQDGDQYERLNQLESEIELLTAYTSDTIYRLSFETMKYNYISPTVTKLLGFTPAEMKAINFRNLILETRLVTDGLKTVSSFTELEDVRKDGDVNKWEADYKICTKDGRHIWVNDVSHPWFDESGKVIGSVGSLRDISQRVEAEIQLNEEMEKFANTDALTGAANRREFFDMLDRELKRIGRTEEDVAMLLIDIDHFRKVNEQHGTEVGDILLVEVAKVIKSCLRDTDLLSRLGGEEFGVLLPDTSAQGAYWVAERIRTAVLKSEVMIGSDQPPVSCSVSIGVSSATSFDEKKSSDMFKEADTRLYIAKNTGRNQVSVDEIMHTH